MVLSVVSYTVFYNFVTVVQLLLIDQPESYASWSLSYWKTIQPSQTCRRGMPFELYYRCQLWQQLAQIQDASVQNLGATSGYNSCHESLIQLITGTFKIPPNIYNGAFCKKLAVESRDLCSQKASSYMLDTLLGTLLKNY